MNTAFCFDLDGTVTSREILPVLASELGFYEEIMTLTDVTIKGLIPFESSFKLRCKILSDIPISRVQALVSEIPFFEDVARFLKANSYCCYVITGNLDAWIAPLMARLGVQFFSSEAETEGDRLVRIKSILNKADVIDQLRPAYDRIVAVGDGMGDVAMFEKADVRIAFGGVHQPIESLVQLADLVCFSEAALCNALSTL